MQEPQETQVPSLGREDRLEEAVGTHSSSLAMIIPWTKEPSKILMGSQIDVTEVTEHICVYACEYVYVYVYVCLYVYMCAMCACVCICVCVFG